MLDIKIDKMKRFHISGCVWPVDIYTQQEWSACTCVSLSPCVCLRKIWLKAELLRSAEELQDSSFWLSLSLLLHGAASVCLSPDCYGANYFFLFLLSLSYSCFLLLDELSWACVAFLPHLLLFLFIPQWGVSGETGILDLSLWIVRTVGVLGERLGHVGASKPPGLQQCPALLWVLEWPNGGLIACWHAACSLSLITEVFNLYASVMTWVMNKHNPSLFSSMHWINDYFLFACMQFFTLAALMGVELHCMSGIVRNHSLFFRN